MSCVSAILLNGKSPSLFAAGELDGRGVVIPKALEYAVLALAAVPLIYYFLGIYSTVRFFYRAERRWPIDPNFTPPISNLKPVRGLDPEAYENFASYCRQDYPNYELLFCVHDEQDPAVPVLKKLMQDFPSTRIRILYGSGRNAINDKVAKLVRLVSEAKNELLVINDSDVRVRPDYFRSVIAPMQRAGVGGVTTLYVSVHDTTFTQRLQSMGMISDFDPGIFVARELDGVKFAFGQTIVTTRTNIGGFGGFQAIESRPADDLLTGRLIAEQGLEVELLPYAVQTVPDYQSTRELIIKRVRWMTVMRNMRPWGHVGLLFTHGIGWAFIAIAVRPTWVVAACYFGIYLLIRMVITWLVGVWGLKQKGIWRQMPLVVLWDATALAIWIVSFFQRSIRWRGVDYKLRGGYLVRGAQTDAKAG